MSMRLKNKILSISGNGACRAGLFSSMGRIARNFGHFFRFRLFTFSAKRITIGYISKKTTADQIHTCLTISEIGCALFGTADFIEDEF
ncbi:MAG TPA: hypothetical protein DC013_08485 [Ruminococcaceae bacterium]|nr:hypothetical protein [Oscillospiraceae bacterium]